MPGSSVYILVLGDSVCIRQLQPQMSKAALLSSAMQQAACT